MSQERLALLEESAAYSLAGKPERAGPVAGQASGVSRAINIALIDQILDSEPDDDEFVDPVNTKGVRYGQ